MKKVFSGIILFILFILSGCEGTPFTPDFAPVQAFTLVISATINEKEFQATLSCRSYEEIELAFTAPEQMAGFTARTQGDGYAMDVLGVPADVAAGELYADSPFRLLFDTVKTAVFTNHGAFIRNKETGVYTADLTVNGVPVSVTFDGDGYLTEIGTSAFHAVFSR